LSTEVLDNIPLALRNAIAVRESSRDVKRNCMKMLIELNPDVLTSHGEIPGGLISMLTIATAEILATTSLQSNKALLVINHNVHFLKHPETLSDIEIESCILSRGERILSISSYARCGEIDVAYTLSTFVVEDR